MPKNRPYFGYNEAREFQRVGSVTAAIALVITGGSLIFAVLRPEQRRLAFTPGYIGVFSLALAMFWFSYGRLLDMRNRRQARR